MATVSSLRHRNYGVTQENQENKLFVFGYSCKIFRDDEKATYIDQGKHLIPWMGDENVMIDRYDARGYLHDLESYEARPGGYSLDDLSEEEQNMEKRCEEERYLALHKDLTEEQMYHEEELKRLKAAVAGDGAYHEIGFTYDNSENEQDGSKLSADMRVEEPDDEPYQIPPGLEIPKGIELPSNMKIHAIIEKTALFISQQGGQMEVLLRIKQSNNPQFAFIHLENPLHPYYKHLVKELKAGKYKPPETKKSVGDTDDESEDDYYLHPSLMSGKPELVPEFTLPSINFRRSSDDSYYTLVRNLKQHIIVEDSRSSSPSVHVVQDQSNAGSPFVAEEEDRSYNHQSSEIEAGKSISQPPPPGEEGNVDEDDKQSATSVSSSITDSPLTETSGDELQENVDSKVVPPPPDVQPIIDKMAEYVAKNGEDFEFIVKSKNDKRFDFLNPLHKYYQYYLLKRIAAKADLQPPVEKVEAPLQSSIISDEVKPEVNSEIKTVEADSAVNVQDETEELKASDSDHENSSNCVIIDKTEVKMEVDETSQCDTPAAPEVMPLDQEEEEEKLKEVKPIKVTPRVVKGPISFSLKSKDVDGSNLEKKSKRSLLLDDSDGEEETLNAEKKPKGDLVKKHKVNDDLYAVRTTKDTHLLEVDDKLKKQHLEEMEAKIAEEKLKDKLAAAAREKFTQQKREKQLQLERKRRLNIFLQKMNKTPVENSLESAFEINNYEASEAGNIEKQSRVGIVESSPRRKDDDKNVSPTISEITSPKNGALHSLEKNCSLPPSPSADVLPDNKWSSPSPSSSAPSSDEQENPVELKEISQLERKHSKHKTKKRRKHTHSSKEISQKSHRTLHSKSRRRSRSPSRHKSHKQISSRNHRHRRSRSRSRSSTKRVKTLPAAYAFGRRSRSRSRSPRRHKSNSRLSPIHRAKKRP